MRIEFWLDEGEKEVNIGIAKALTETHLSLADLQEIYKYLAVFIESRKEGGE